MVDVYVAMCTFSPEDDGAGPGTETYAKHLARGWTNGTSECCGHQQVPPSPPENSQSRRWAEEAATL
jgi:hypothetical protein